MAPQAAIENNLFEIVGTEYYQKIVRYTGSLAQDTEYVYTTGETEDGDLDRDEEFTGEITEARVDGGFQQKLSRLDELSVGSGSSVMMVQILGSKLDYQPIPVNQIWVAYNGSITENDVERPANSLDIEEASVVVIMLEAGDRNKYVAFFPRSDKYPQGRQVTYFSRTWHNIPPEGEDPEATEATDNSGAIANPLTVLQDRSKDWTIPEIPVVVWTGTTKGIGTTLLPYDEALYNTCLELDLSASRSMTSLNRSATGTLIFTSEPGSSPVWSDNLGEGTTLLKPGQSATMLNLPPQGGEALMDGVERMGAMIGDAYGVPGYLLATGDSAQVPSGTALMELNQPAAKMRRKRAELNRAAMQRIFDVERGLAAIDNDDPGYAANVRQQWIVHDMAYVKTDEQRLTEAKLELELKVKGQRELVREHVDGMDNATDEQVDEYIAGLKLAAAPAPPALGRFSAAGAQAQQQG
jgi:hypothetical protein